MKQINGIYLPDNDTHFEAHLLTAPLHRGAGTYQFSKITAALDVVPPDRRDLALDIGAHVGLWSRVLASYFQQVVAFEPIPVHIECFRVNLADFPNVDLREVALGNYRSNDVPFRAELENSGNSRLISPRDIGDAVHVQMDVLDGIELPGPVDFIKIDVEGLELRVIQGGEHLIKRDRPFIVVEQKPGHAERYGMTQRAAVDLLQSWGMVQKWVKAGDHCLAWE
jgi:FkbM family methyltransferase